MPREIAVGGILFPGLLLLAIASALMVWGIDWVIGRFGLYRFVWHPPLFRLAIAVSVFGASALLLT